MTLVTLAAIAAVIVGGRFLTGPLFRFIHMARLREIYTAVALVIVVGIAFLMVLVGLTPALGAFVAGVVLANSEFKHELEANIEPFKGLLLGLFFITVGAGINFDMLLSSPLTILSLTLAVMIAKGLILYGIGLGFGLRGRDQWLFTLSLAQAGEFGFVLISYAVSQRVLPDVVTEVLLLIVALSMLFTPLFFILYESCRGAARPGIPRRTDPNRQDRPAGKHHHRRDRPFRAGGQPDAAPVGLQDRGSGQRPCHHPASAPLRLSRLFRRPDATGASACRRDRRGEGAGGDDGRPARHAAPCRVCPQYPPDLHIVARAYDRVHTYELTRPGPMTSCAKCSTARCARRATCLENIGLTEYEAHEVQAAFYRHDRHTLRELAGLWQPGVPMARTRPTWRARSELNSNLETALATQIDAAELPDDAGGGG